jgi:D-alanine transaminase
VRQLELSPPAVRQNGVRIMTAQDIRWLRCDVKSVCLLPNVMAANKAKAAGCYEALFIAPDGTLTECASANVFIVKNGVVITPPKSANILGGITREEVIALARKHRVPLQERRITLKQLLAADEVFLTGTTTEILPVVRVDNHRIASGKPGLVTRRLYELFLRHVG